VTGGPEIHGAVSALHPALAGHFPGNPVVPGVLILERVCRALQQSHGVTVAAVPVVKFQVPLHPDEPFAIRLEPAGAGRYSFRVVRGDTVVATGTIETGAPCA
jgi:3-hydroxyacyl-[acyl-carrier-protein] dehydratase